MAAAAAHEQRLLNVNLGILGHIDSGKTSLARALSTTLSTAALDKHPQSVERGITLDLGFSSFTAPLPQRLADAPFDAVQITLVDCPGHASLIRTIMGGAQIIDMMLLVIDVTKGASHGAGTALRCASPAARSRSSRRDESWLRLVCGAGIQTQTAECLIIGELTTTKLIVVLNKADLLPVDTHDATLAKLQKRLTATFAATRFAGCTQIVVSARPGGGDSMAAGGALPYHRSPRSTSF
jgi:selenocysteine-specific elongation factor